MSKTITRRDLLKLAGGSALGFFFTPIPWKLLDDTAIWSQNWSLIPKVPRGPVTYAFSVCTLCPAGCALKAKCVNGIPVQLNGVAHHPLSKGALCPIGFAGHHAGYHPMRISSPVKFNGKGPNAQMQAVPFDQAVSEISDQLSTCGSNASVAVLDRVPGRAISSAYQEFLQTVPNGVYLTGPSHECTTTTRLAELMHSGSAALGYDFENAGTVISFGAPLFDGWGTPGRMIALRNLPVHNRPRFIHVESRQSRTALQSDCWLPVYPGTEAALALGIAHLLITEKKYQNRVADNAADLNEYKKMTGSFSPETVETITGLPKNKIIEAAHLLADTTPSIAIAGCDPAGGPMGRSGEIAIAGLNLLLGSVGRRGGIVSRKEISREKFSSAQLAEIQDHSIGLLFIDDADSGYSWPWEVIERKLIPGRSMVVALSPYAGGIAAHADYIIPSPAHLESVRDVTTPKHNRVATFAIAPALFPARKESVEPAELLARIAQKSGLSAYTAQDQQQLIKKQSELIYAAKRGNLISFADGSNVQVKTIASADDLHSALIKGSVWMDDDSIQHPAVKFSLLGNQPEQLKAFASELKNRPSVPQGFLPLVPFGWRSAHRGGEMSPLLSKLFQESGLRHLDGVAVLNPLTAEKFGLGEGDRAVVETQSGTMNTSIHLDAAFMPEILHLAAGPVRNGEQHSAATEGTLALCSIHVDGTWGSTSAKIWKA